MTKLELTAQPLTGADFKPFGDVIETQGRQHHTINNGMGERFHDLAKLDLLAENGRPLVSIVQGKPRAFPLKIEMLERHPLSSQAFIPLSARPFLIVTAEGKHRPEPADLTVFITNGKQGVNYRRAVWHHPLIPLKQESDFIVIDRGADDENCDEHWFDGTQEIIINLD